MKSFCTEVCLSKFWGTTDWFCLPEKLMSQHLHPMIMKCVIRLSFNPIQDGLFRGCSRMGELFGPSSLKSVTHILQWWNLAQLYLTWGRPKKYINHVTHPLISAGISIFSPEISKFCYIKKYRYRLDFDT